MCLHSFIVLCVNTQMYVAFCCCFSIDYTSVLHIVNIIIHDKNANSKTNKPKTTVVCIRWWSSIDSGEDAGVDQQ